MAAGMKTLAPSASLVPVMASANFPNVFMPNSLLMPSQHGNPSRKFNDQELGELIAENKALIGYALSYATWATNTDVLTSVMLPKIKLKEGVQRIEGKQFEYDIVPTTAVPARGTVRFMSKNIRAFSIAIGQKGIGSKFEGRALRSEFGPQLLAMEVQAYAESISLGMALNSAINLVNAAHRYSLKRHGPSYMVNLAQEMAREIGLWCRLGVDASRVATEISRILDEKPDMNTLLVPSNYLNYMREADLQRTERMVTRHTMVNGEIVELEDKDHVVALTTLVGGQVYVHQCPDFRFGRLNMRPLSTISRIGEFYTMHGEFDSTNREFLASSLHIYVYDENQDRHSKIMFDDAMHASAIWGNPTGQYDERLIKKVAAMNLPNAPERNVANMARRRRMFPISLHSDANPANPDQDPSAKFFLPKFVGNLDVAHLGDRDLRLGVASVVKNIVSTGGNLLTEADEDIKMIELLRVAIEEEPYNADYFAELIKLNIDRSVKFVDNKAVFSGQLTSKERAAAHNTAPIVEWAADRYGGFSFPVGYAPAGAWTAGCLLSIANNKAHPYADKCANAYTFFSVMASRAKESLLSSAIFSFGEMPINMPRNDEVQLIMTACFGPRVPLFLAATLSAASAAKSYEAQTRRAVDRSAPLVNYTVVGDDALAKSFEKAGTGSANQGNFTRNEDRVVWRSPAGVVFVLPGQRDTYFKSSPKLDGTALTQRILGNGAYARLDGLQSPTTEQKSKFKAFVDRQVATLDEKSVRFAILVTQRLNSGISDEEAATFVKSVADANKAGLGKIIQGLGDPDATASGSATANLAAYAQESGSPSLSGSNLALARTMNNFAEFLRRDAERRAVVNPGFNLRNKYFATSTVRPEGLSTEYSELTRNDVSPESRQQFDEFVQTLRSQSESAGDASGAMFIDGNAMVIDEQSPFVGAAVASATYYRTPLVMSYALLASLMRVEVPLILPGDTSTSFNTPLNLSDDIRGNFDTTLFDLPHYSQSKAIISSQLKSWTDSGIYSRLALVSKQYDSLTSSSSSSSSHRMASGALRSHGLIDDVYQGIADSHASAPKPLVSESIKATYMGGMMNFLRFVHGEWHSNFVMRFAALAYLMMPLSSLESLKTMVLNNVYPPFGMIAWRLRSDHEVSAFLLGVAGIKTGANFFNGTHFDWAKDGTRDVYQTRVVITTDAAVLREENLRLIPAVMPLQYRGGHNDRIVNREVELREGLQSRQPSIIITVSSLRDLRNLATPLSFINRPPAEIDRVGNDVMEVDLDRQYFAGADYYSNYVYPSIYGAAMQTDAARSITVAQGAYKNEPQENHIAMRGYHVRYDYKMRHYCREIMGNGHRNDKRLNFPGARAYLNGETTILPGERDIVGLYLN